MAVADFADRRVCRKRRFASSTTFSPERRVPTSSFRQPQRATSAFPRCAARSGCALSALAPAPRLSGGRSRCRRASDTEHLPWPVPGRAAQPGSEPRTGVQHWGFPSGCRSAVDRGAWGSPRFSRSRPIPLQTRPGMSSDVADNGLRTFLNHHPLHADHLWTLASLAVQRVQHVCHSA